jgi:hypothetical protein
VTTRLVVLDIEAVKAVIAEAVRDAVARNGAGDDWVDAKTSPLGKRAFHRLARANAFPVSKIGRKLVARRSDVEAYLEAQRVRFELPVSAPSEDADPVARALARGRLRVVKRE